MNKNLKIAPSLFAADFLNLESAVKTFENAGVDYIHYDIMDNHFVPNLSFGAKLVEDICKKTRVPSDVHLMIDLDKLHSLSHFLELPVEHITIHLEATQNYLVEFIKQIKSSGKTAGISIKPGTPIESIIPYIDYIDLVLLMSVEPGFSGQKFISGTLKKIGRLKYLLGKRPVSIQIDGGIGRENYISALQEGADFLVMGSAFYKDRDTIGLVKAIHTFQAK